MHDFRCTEASEMYYEVLRERVRLFKEKEEGVSEMCDFLEQLEIRNQAIGKAAGKAEGKTEGMLTAIKALIEEMSLTEALDLLKIPSDERPMYIKKITS